MTNLINFDPNYVANFNRAKQKIKLVFGVWNYRAEFIIDVEINSYGMNSFSFAIKKVYDSIFDEKKGFAFLNLTNIDAITIQDCDAENDEEEWLKSILISAEIISYEEGKLWE